MDKYGNFSTTCVTKDRLPQVAYAAIWFSLYNIFITRDSDYHCYLFRQSESGLQGCSDFGLHSQAEVLDLSGSKSFTLPTGLFVLILP